MVIFFSLIEMHFLMAIIEISALFATFYLLYILKLKFRFTHHLDAIKHPTKNHTSLYDFLHLGHSNNYRHILYWYVKNTNTNINTKAVSMYGYWYTWWNGWIINIRCNFFLIGKTTGFFYYIDSFFYDSRNLVRRFILIVSIISDGRLHKEAEFEHTTDSIYISAELHFKNPLN